MCTAEQVFDVDAKNMKLSKYLAAESRVLGACVYRFREDPVKMLLNDRYATST
jgi:hypothetical protein